MKRGSSILLSSITVAAVLLVCDLKTSWSRQAQEQAAVELNAVDPLPAKQEKDASSPAESDDPAVESVPRPVITSIEGSYIRFHMWDGLIVGGDASIDAIDVETEFGALKIPISKILRFYPGLDSMQQLQSKIDQLVEDLGDRDFEVRERSHNELLGMGGLLRTEINRFEDGGSAERKKHLADLRKKLDELEEDIEGPIRPLIRGDYIETPDFSIVGKIVQKQFRLQSQFGEMTIPLSQIQTADRTFGLANPEVRKSIEIQATSFFPEGIGTKIKINRGDKITISATGSVNWQNWSTNCGPEGMTDKGQFQSFNSGALLARIGKEKYFKVGSNSSFVADVSGELYLGIAMADNFKTGGYTWNGNYQAKLVVKPQGNR